MSTIGQNVRYYRLCAGLSQRELAKRAGIAVISVRRYEEETGEQTVKTIRKIANALEIPLCEILDTSKDLPVRSTVQIQRKKPQEPIYPETQNWVYLDIDKVNETRYRKGLSLCKVAELAGMSRYTVHKALTGKRIRATTAEKIERAVIVGMTDKKA